MSSCTVKIKSGSSFSALAVAIRGTATAAAVVGAGAFALPGGAAAGVGFDAITGGLSLFAGAAIGAVAGGAAAWFAADKFADFETATLPFGEQEVVVSAGKSRNLPFVLLGRARAHHRLVARRSHAERATLVVDSEADPLPELDSANRSALAQLFAKLGGLSGDAPQSLMDDLRAQIETCLRADEA